MSNDKICICGETKDLYLHITGWKCDGCLDKLIKEKVNEFYKNLIDTGYRDEVICPNCGHKHGHDLMTFGDMSGEEYECGFCLDNFYVMTEYTPDFTTWRVEDDTRENS